MEGTINMLQLFDHEIILHRSLEFLPKVLSLVAMATTVTVGGSSKYILKYYEVHMKYH